MSIQLPDGSVVSNWSPGWEKNLPQWYIDGYETGLFNESNNWGHDFFPQTTYNSPTVTPPVIKGGPSMVPGYPTTKGTIHHSFPEAKMPSGNSGGWGRHFDREGMAIPESGASPRPEGLQRGGTGIADWFTGNKFDFDQRGPGKKFLDLITKGAKNVKTGNTFSQDVPNMAPVPPIDPGKVLEGGRTAGKGVPGLPPTLRQRVWERDQMPKRVPNELGQLYPDKNDPGFIDPRIQGNGMMTLPYIPELDNPNWTPSNPYDGVGQFGSGTLPM